MQHKEDNQKTVTDYITGEEIPDIEAEANRQAVERFLLEKKGYLKNDIEVDAAIMMIVAGEPYRSS